MKKSLQGLALVVALAAGTALIGAVGQSAGPPGKVTICHKDKVTINVSLRALPAHLVLHGDSFGECGGGGDPL